MKKRKKITQETDDSRTYKLTVRKQFNRCPYCKPNQGCNRKGGRNGKKNKPFWKNKNWKKYRKTQWRH
jgi:hypothetical protein